MYVIVTQIMGLTTCGFVVTEWNIINTREDYEKIMEDNGIRFIAYGREICPESGRPHHQMFMYLWSPSTFGKKKLNIIGNWWGKKHCNVAPMRGSFRNNADYCSKESSLIKIGDEPRQGARGDIAENVAMIRSGELDPAGLRALDFQHAHLYGRTYDKVYQDTLSMLYRTEMTEGVWLHGPTGCGKSMMAFAGFDPLTHYVFNTETKWWDGYRPDKHMTIIIDEFRGEIAFRILLRLLDKWPFKVPVRNCPDVPFLAKKVIITSSMSPEKVARREWNLHTSDSIDQLKRRLRIQELGRLS